MADVAMVGKFVRMPEGLWERLTVYALELSQAEGKQVSTSEAMRRILERALRRREQAREK